VYGSAEAEVAANVSRMVRNYASAMDQGLSTSALNEAAISWSRSLKRLYERGVEVTFDPSKITRGAYRPFQTQHVYLDRDLNEDTRQFARIHPTPRHQNTGIFQVGAASAVPFSALATRAVPDLHFTGAGSGGQFFPRWSYEALLDDSDRQGAFDLDGPEAVVVDGYRQVDNITDAALTEYRTAYGPEVTKDDVFYYVYGLLHSPDYRETFAADLKRMLPRIPKVADRKDFEVFVAAGRELADLHIDYEAVQPWPGLTVTGDVPSGQGSADVYDWFRVEKMRFGGKGRAKDRSTVIYNSRITVSGIPDEAHEYLLGSRTAIEWILERYQVKTDKASGIVNDPNDWSREVGDPRYILDLLRRIVTVSVETVRIVNSLPGLQIGD